MVEQGIPKLPALGRPAKGLLRLALAAIAGLLALIGLAVGLRSWTTQVWGACHSTDCAFLPLTPVAGLVAVALVYVALAAVAIKQLLFQPPWRAFEGRPWTAHAQQRLLGVPNRLWQTTALLLLLALVAFWRLQWLPLASFKHDEAVTGLMALEIVRDGHLYLVGIASSIRVPQLPGALYLLAPWTLLGPQPMLLAGLGVTASLVATYLCYAVGARWFSAGAGLAAALVFAASFWPAYCGTRVWQQCLLPPFSLLFLDAVLLLTVSGQAWALVNASFWAAVMTHLHILSPSYLLALPLALLFARLRLQLRLIALAGLAFIGPLAPYLLWQITPNVRFNDARILWNLNADGNAELDLTPLRFLLDLAGAGGAETLALPHEALFLSHSWPWLSLAWLGAGLAVAGLVILVAALGSSGNKRAVAVPTIACLLAPTLPLYRHSTGIFPHYLYGALPIIALCAGLAVADFPRVWRPHAESRHAVQAGIKILRFAPIILLFLSVAASVQVAAALRDVVPDVETEEYGVPLAYTHSAAQAAMAAWRSSQSTNPIYVGGHRKDVQVFRYLLSGDVPWTTETFDDCKALPDAANDGPAVVLTWSADSPTARRLAATGESLLSAERLPRPGQTAFGLYLVEGAELQGQSIESEEAKDFATCAGRI